jgi:hypothetical protein
MLTHRGMLKYGIHGQRHALKIKMPKRHSLQYMYERPHPVNTTVSTTEAAIKEYVCEMRLCFND